jgi:hypothetical protein
LRDYQRSVAKARSEIEEKNAVSQPNQTSPQVSQEFAPPQRAASPKVYVSPDAPMSLSQTRYVGPKKFKPLRKRPNVNLEEVRALLGNANKKEK